MEDLNKTLTPEEVPAAPEVPAEPVAPAAPVAEAAPAVEAVPVAPAAPAKKKLNKTMIIGIVAGLFILLAIILAFGGGAGGGLSGDDKIAYEIIVDAAPKFKDPSSVRITGGVLGYNDEDDYYYLFCTISANNSYGSRVSKEYYMTTEGTVLAYESDLASRTDRLNLSKINKKLEKKLKL